jgi:hypothetical protein
MADMSVPTTAGPLGTVTRTSQARFEAAMATAGGRRSSGWDTATGTQTLALGRDASITLRGGGPNGENLEISVSDPTVAIVHELPGRTGSGLRTLVITALGAGDAEIRARLPGAAEPLATMHVSVTSDPSVGNQLVFFPGEEIHWDEERDTWIGSICMIGQGQCFPAAGGPPIRFQGKGFHMREPTTEGRYILGPQQRVTTSSWTRSTIPWGAALRIKNGEVEYEAAPNVWRTATGRSGVVTAASLAWNRRSGIARDAENVIEEVRALFIDKNTGALRFTEWRQNDFGPWAWHLLRPQEASTSAGEAGGRRGIRGITGGALTPKGGGNLPLNPTGLYLHTTPDNEEQTALNLPLYLTQSHGCLHVPPAARDMMMAAGYLPPEGGTVLIVKSYDLQKPR